MLYRATWAEAMLLICLLAFR